MLKPVDHETYTAVKAAVPEHDRKFLTWSRMGSLYYEQEEVFDEQGNLVAIHSKSGQRYADTSLLTGGPARQTVSAGAGAKAKTEAR